MNEAGRSRSTYRHDGQAIGQAKPTNCCNGQAGLNSPRCLIHSETNLRKYKQFRWKSMRYGVVELPCIEFEGVANKTRIYGGVRQREGAGQRSFQRSTVPYS